MWRDYVVYIMKLPCTIWKYFKIESKGSQEEPYTFNIFCQTLCDLAVITTGKVEAEEECTGKANPSIIPGEWIKVQ